MLVQNKVVKLDNNSVYDEIVRYFERLERQSTTTRKAYETDIRLYYKLMHDIEIEHLQSENVQLTLDHFEDYVKRLQKLKDRKGGRYYTNQSINRKVTALKELLKYLAAKGITKDIGYFPLIESLKSVTDHYDSMTVDECIRMSQLALEEKENGKMKSLMIMFALHTGLRKAEILNVCWKDFTVKRDSDVVQLKGVGKGTKGFKKYLDKEFFEELKQIKGESEFVFPMATTTVDKMFVRLRDKMDFGNRNIVFHSLRKASGLFIMKMTNNIETTRKFLNHANVNTTQVYLVGDEQEEEIFSALCRIDKIDNEMYKKVDLDTLITAITEMNYDDRLKLNKKLMEIVERK